MRSPGQLLICILGLWGWTAPLMAGGVTTIIIDGRKAHTSISLPKPGGGNYTADFELEFHNPVNLTPACLGISAEVLDAAAIAGVQARLPDPVNQTIDSAFPVRITVEPPAGCGLEFEDEVDIELDTADLVYTGFSPYRLMKAPVGSSFRDITASVTAGSVRSRGRSGTFSEFVMVLDAVQAYAVEAQQAFDVLDAQLANIAIGPTAKQTLQSDASVSRSAFAVNDYAQAIAHLNDLTGHCGVLGGPALPNRWRSLRDLQNIEGEIVGQTDHLKFLLGRLNGVP